MRKSGAAALLLVLLLAAAAFIPDVCADDGHGNLIVVSMGDSFSSGEGIEPFYGQDGDLQEKIRNPDWLAHRSMRSWAGRLVFPELGIPLKDVPRGAYHDGVFTPGTWFFVASSGATTANLTVGQVRKTRQSSASGSERHTLEAQCGVLHELRARGMYADYITITIGGNDLDFSGIITSAVVGGNKLSPAYLLPAAIDKALQRFYEGGVREEIRQAYRNIRDANGGKGKLLVAGYPRLVDEQGSGLPFSLDEARRLNSAVSQFNQELERLVDECRGEGMDIWFIPVEKEFRNKGAYAPDALINPVIPGAGREDLDITRPVSAYSMHPNEAGAAAYARAVQKFIDEALPGGTQESGAFSGEPEPPAENLIRLDLDIGFEKNTLFSVYDVRMFLDGQYVATLAHGEGYQGSLEVTPGVHTISFRQVGKSDVSGSGTFGANQPARFSCVIHARRNRIDITGARTAVVSAESPQPGQGAVYVNGRLILGVNIVFKRNRISSRYDVDLYVDGVYVATLPHGNDYQGKLGVSEGMHVLTFCRAGDKSVSGTSRFSVHAGSVFSCRIEAKRNQVKVSEEKIR